MSRDWWCLCGAERAAAKLADEQRQRDEQDLAEQSQAAEQDLLASLTLVARHRYGVDEFAAPDGRRFFRGQFHAHPFDPGDEASIAAAALGARGKERPLAADVKPIFVDGLLVFQSPCGRQSILLTNTVASFYRAKREAESNANQYEQRLAKHTPNNDSQTVEYASIDGDGMESKQ